MKNKIYTIIGIVGLLSVMCFIIYLVGNFIYFGVYEVNEMCNRNTTNCSDANMLEPDNGVHPPVKGVYSYDKLDSIVVTKHVDLSSIDGDNFYSRDLNPGNRNITPNVISYPIRHNDYYDDAYDDGYSSGHNNGYDEGYEEGYETAKRELENN